MTQSATAAVAEPDDPLVGLKTLQQQQALTSHLFPSLDSLRWFVRRNRAVLQRHGALLEIAGRLYTRPERFALSVLDIGTARSESRGRA